MPPLTLARAIPLSSFEQAAGFFSRWQGRFEQLSPGPFSGRLNVVHTPQLRLFEISGNQQILMQGRNDAPLVSVYPVTPGLAANRWQGRRLDPGHLVVHGLDAEVRHCSARKCHGMGLSVPPGVLLEAARAFLQVEGLSVPDSVGFRVPPPERFEAFERGVARVLRAGLADPTVLLSREGEQLEQECLRVLVGCLFAAQERPLAVSLPERARAVDRAEGWMRARLTDPAGMLDLCRELGVSDRTLRLGFRERYGMGPMNFFRSLRLNAVRFCLKAGGQTSVADCAQEYGFHHLGNFAADYRRLFGELPSATARLARPADER